MSKKATVFESAYLYAPCDPNVGIRSCEMEINFYEIDLENEYEKKRLIEYLSELGELIAGEKFRVTLVPYTDYHDEFYAMRSNDKLFTRKEIFEIGTALWNDLEEEEKIESGYRFIPDTLYNMMIMIENLSLCDCLFTQRSKDKAKRQIIFKENKTAIQRKVAKIYSLDNNEYIELAGTNEQIVDFYNRMKEFDINVRLDWKWEDIPDSYNYRTKE